MVFAFANCGTAPLDSSTLTGERRQLNLWGWRDDGRSFAFAPHVKRRPTTHGLQGLFDRTAIDGAFTESERG